jgi:hypothetical protein
VPRVSWDERVQGGERTCEVQTLLKSTNAAVCANHASGRCCLCRPKSSPAPSVAPSCGPKLARGDRKIRAASEGVDVEGTEDKYAR